MGFYNNIYASYVRILESLDNRDSRSTAVLLLSVSQVSQVALLIGVIKYFFEIDLVPHFPSKYYVLLFTVPLLLILLIYYSRKRAEKILNLYNEKSKKEKWIWKIVSLLMIIIPIALFPILFGKRV